MKELALIVSAVFFAVSQTAIWATVWSATGSIELYQDGQSGVTANAVSTAKAEMISPEHANSTRLRIRGNLYRHSGLNSCDQLEQTVRDTCTGSKIVGDSTTSVLCSTGRRRRLLSSVGPQEFRDFDNA